MLPNPSLPSEAHILPSLPCSTAQLWARAAEISGTFGQPSVRRLLSFSDYNPRRVMKSCPARSWDVESFATIQSKVSYYLPSLHSILVKVKDFLAVLKTHKL